MAEPRRAGRPHRLSQLPPWVQDKIIGELLEGRSNYAIGKEHKVSEAAVRRWFENAVSEEKKREVAARQRIAKVQSDTDVIHQDRLDIAITYESLAMRVEKLITKAEENGDDGFALAAMEGLRKVLKDIAQMQGKLARDLTVNVTLAQAPEWIALREVLLDVCEQVPEARAPLLAGMRKRALSAVTDVEG